jgi:solute carrier family 25 S-adenosylmethionine transporter 26
MLELGLYETTQACARRMRAKTELNPVEKAVCATATGTVTGWLTNPLDLVKTRLMAGSEGGGLVACFRSVHAEGGLFKGAGARATWMFIAFPIYFALYDATLAWLERRADKNA